MDWQDKGLTLEQLAVFLAVVETGSFSGAGRRLHKVQSAVSYSIATLEERLGVILFDRSSRRVTPTAAAKALLPDVEGVLARVQALSRRASTRVELSLSLVYDSLLPLSCLFQPLRTFRHEFPDTRLVLHDETLSAVSAALRDGSADIGFAAGVAGVPEVISEQFGDLKMMTIAAANHPLCRKEGVWRREELDEHTQIVVSSRVPQEGRDYGVFSRTTWRVPDYRTKLALIEEGFGFGSVPAHLGADAIAGGRCRLVAFEGRETGVFQVPIFAQWPNNKSAGPAGRWLVGEVRTALKRWSQNVS